MLCYPHCVHFHLHLRSALCIYRTPERPNSQNKCTLDLPVWNHMKSQFAQTLWVKSRRWINLFEKLKIREREVVKHFEQWDPYITSFPNSLWNHWIMWHCEIIELCDIDMKPIWKLSEWKLWKNHKHRKLKKDGTASVEQRDLHGRIPGTASVNFLLQSGWKARPPCRYNLAGVSRYIQVYQVHLLVRTVPKNAHKLSLGQVDTLRANPWICCGILWIKPHDSITGWSSII